MAEERTFIMIKPDGVQRGLVGKIVQRFEERGFKLVALKFVQPTTQLLEQHYADLKGKPFFPGLVQYMSSGPVVPMVWEGLNAVKMGRKMLGATKPADSEPGTIRGDFCLDVGRNLCHGSDSAESAAAEIKLWFKHAELVAWSHHSAGQVYEKPPPAASGASSSSAAAPPAAKGKDKGGDKKEGKKAEAAVDPEKEKAKLLKATIKEGGKKGVEMEGASDMGGLDFFVTSVETPDGDMELLKECVKAMNAEPDPTAEERKGGAGHIGKVIFSAGAKKLVMMSTVPEDKKAKVSSKEWMAHVLASVGGRPVGTPTDTESLGEVDGDADKGLFPIKMKDVALAAAVAYLREKGCFPDDDDDDDDDEMVFGDDDDLDNFE